MQAARTAGKGMLMGLADLVPGISGGTVALLLGIHPRLVAAIAAFGPTTPLDILRAGRDDQAKVRVRALDLPFLLPLAFGIIAIIFLGSHAMESLLHWRPDLLMALFLGLLLASLPVAWRNVFSTRWMVLPGVALPIVLMALPAGEGPATMLTWFAVGAIALIAMILPGVSGSGLLVIFGAYAGAVRAVADLDLTVLVPFAVGGILGLLLASRGLSWLFAHRPNGTWAFLTGLVAGSMARVWPWRTEADFGEGLPALPDGQVALLVATGLVGWLLVRVLDRSNPTPQTP